MSTQATAKNRRKAAKIDPKYRGAKRKRSAKLSDYAIRMKAEGKGK